MHRRLVVLISMLGIFVSSCDTSVLLPSSADGPTLVPGMVETIVVATARAAENSDRAVHPAHQHSNVDSASDSYAESDADAKSDFHLHHRQN